MPRVAQNYTSQMISLEIKYSILRNHLGSIAKRQMQEFEGMFCRWCFNYSFQHIKCWISKTRSAAVFLVDKGSKHYSPRIEQIGSKGWGFNLIFEIFRYSLALLLIFLLYFKELKKLVLWEIYFLWHVFQNIKETPLEGAWCLAEILGWN